MATSHDRRFRPTCESLEQRDLLSGVINATLTGGALKIVGTNGSDTIIVRQINNNLSIDGVAITAGTAHLAKVPIAQVKSISIEGLGGNDTIRLDMQPGQQSMRLPTVITDGDGNDTIYGSDGPNVIEAGNGNDLIHGGAGNDVIHAGNGNNKLYGGAGNDKLYAGSGADYLDGGTGQDTLVGGTGVDTFHRDMIVPGQSTPDPTILNAPAKATTAVGYQQIDQSTAPTCVFLAALASVANSSSNNLLKNISFNAGTDLYGVKLFVNKAWQAIWVSGDWNAYWDPKGALWVTLYQKAYLKAMDVVYQTSSGAYLPASQWHSSTGKPWDYPTAALQVLTGIATNFTDISAANPATIAQQLKSGANMVALTPAKVNSEFIGSHGYTVLKASQVKGVWYLTLYNPWGVDGTKASADGKNDGVLTVSWDAFKANFDEIAYT